MSAIVRLTTKDKLAMYRNAFYSLMGARETLPTDQQCLAWLQAISAQAQYRAHPPIGIIAHEPRFVQAAGIVPKVEIRQWDVVVPLPDWTKM